MRFVEKLPPRWRSLAEEIIKFSMVGGVNTVITFVIFNLLLPIGALKSTVIAAVIATTVSYFLNRHWTYRHLPKTALKREYMLFFVFNAIGMAIDTGIMGVASYVMHFDVKTDWLAFNLFKVLALVLGTAFRFWSYRTFVFRAGRPAEEVADAPADPAPAAVAEVPVSPAPVGPQRTAAARTDAPEDVDEAIAEILATESVDEAADSSSSQRLR